VVVDGVLRYLNLQTPGNIRFCSFFVMMACTTWLGGGPRTVIRVLDVGMSVMYLLNTVQLALLDSIKKICHPNLMSGLRSRVYLRTDA
jgi:hypothetical protein